MILDIRLKEPEGAGSDLAKPLQLPKQQLELVSGSSAACIALADGQGERIRRMPVPLVELESTVRGQCSGILTVWTELIPVVDIRLNGGKVHVTLADIARGAAGLV